MAGKKIDIDMAKLRTSIRKQDKEYVYYMLAEAIELLSPTKLYKVVKSYLYMGDLRPDRKDDHSWSLLGEAQDFEKASLTGEYYESFDVNSKNCMEMSLGTAGWIAECRRLIDRCVALEKTSDPVEVRQSFDILFGLLDHIDECHDDVVFISDNWGTWGGFIDWRKVLPSWLRILSTTTTPVEYVKKITSLLCHQCDSDKVKLLEVARKSASQAQRKALDRLIE